MFNVDFEVFSRPLRGGRRKVGFSFGNIFFENKDQGLFVASFLFLFLLFFSF